MTFRSTALCLAVMAGLCLAKAGNASAATLSYEETASGVTGSGTGTAYTSLPVSDIFGNTVPASTGFLGGGADPGFSFYDDYIFTVASSTVDAITVTLNDPPTFDINDLQMRLYSAAGNPSLPVLGDSPAGLQDGWSAPTTSSSDTSKLPTTMLAAGTYVLEVRGDAAGTSGGSYSGVINLQPVPLPAALPLILSGLGLFGSLARKRLAH